jgi:hypothetical protein
VTDDAIWPSFDGWCMEHGIDPWEIPADRWCNLVYYFATRNMDQKAREKFDGQMRQATSRWITLSVENTVKEARTRREAEPVPTGRRRKLPPKPDWYGSRDQATLSSLAAKNTLTSRGGKKTR